MQCNTSSYQKIYGPKWSSMWDISINWGKFRV